MALRSRKRQQRASMYTETINALADQAAAKLEGQRRSLLSHFVRSMLAGMYVGASIVLIFTVGGSLADKAFAGVNEFIYRVFAAKATPPWNQLLVRAVLANWLVCLGVWMAARVRSEPARILLIFWCMFTFITSGYEHSVANMCGLALALLVPGAPPSGVEVTWGLYFYNL